jgi:hyaluronate lyase
MHDNHQPSPVYAAAIVRRVAVILFLSALILRADDFETLINGWAAFATGGTNINLSDPVIASRVSSAVSAANSQWSSLNKATNRTYLWNDAASTTVSADITTCYSRLSTMAQGWAMSGSSLYHNSSLAADILSALDWLYANRYNETKSEYDNWWDWEIGAPMALNQTMVLIYPQISGAQITNYCNSIDHFSPSVTLTGANRVWKAEVVGVRGAVQRNAAKVAAARDGLSDVSGGGANNVFAYVTTSDGFYRDGSFIQHGKHPYTAGYGLYLFRDVVKMMDWLAPTAYVVTDSKSTNVVRWCYDSYEPLIYFGAMPEHLRGREISRNYTGYSAGHSAINTILRVAQTASTNDAARLKSMVKYWAQVDTTATLPSYADIDLVDNAEALIADATVAPRGELVKSFPFPSMDRIMHLRPGFGFSLSLFSSRIYNYECINSENWHGWFTAYGMGYLSVTNDLTQFTDAYWPTVDPYHLPGTTIDQTTLANGAKQGITSSQSWVGGAVLSNTLTAAGMSLADVNGTLVAKKSWFLFDNEIVCLGAGISCSSAANVDTTVENRSLHTSSGNVFTVNGTAMPTTLGWSSNLNNVSWCALDVSGGYYFPGGANLTAARTARTGSWSDINASYSGTYTRNYLSIILIHGVAPNNASYAYVQLPNFSAGATANYATNPQVVILTNTASVQAAREVSQGVTAANFWADGGLTADFITSQNQASVVTRETNGVLEVAVSDPTWLNASTITLKLNRSATSLISADANVTVISLAPQIQLTVNVNGARGQTFQAKFVLSPALVAMPDSAATGGNTPLLIDALANDFSTSGAAIALTNVAVPLHGSASIVNQKIWYVPAQNYTGTDTFNYFITDGSRSATGTVSVAVGGPMLAIATAQLSASDAQVGNPAVNVLDGDLNTRWSAQNTNGILQWLQFDLLSTQLVRGVGLAFWPGTNRFAYFSAQISGDATNWTTMMTNVSSSGTSTNLESFYFPPCWTRFVRIVGLGNSQGTGWNSITEAKIFSATNSAPVAAADSVALLVGTAGMVDVLANDSDPDNGPQPVSLVSFSQPAHGSVSISGSGLRYVPLAGYVGGDNFNYVITDTGLTATGLVSVVVTNFPSYPPMLQPFTNLIVLGGATLTVSSAASDFTAPPQRLLYSLLTCPPGATINSSNGVISWRPTIAQSGTSNLFTVVVTQSGWLNSFSPVADAYVRDGIYTNVNYGSDTNLVVKFSNATGSSRESFLQFNVTNISGTLVSATLQLTPTSASFPGVHSIAPVLNSWSENTLTWSNRPASGAALVTWTPQAAVPVQVPVTPLLNGVISNGSASVSLRIYGTNVTADGLVNYGSREGAGSVAPKLTVASSTGSYLSATQSFWVGVVVPQTPLVSSWSVTGGLVRLSITGSMGPDYTVQGTTNLSAPAWQTLFTTNTPALPIQWSDTNAMRSQFFYRVQVGP